MNDLDKLTLLEGHCEPFAFCHSERSEESLMPSLRVNSVKQSHEIAEPVPSFFEIASGDFVTLTMTTFFWRSL